jgi:hypothetical protein
MKRTEPMRRRKGVKRVNRQRKARSFARNFGSVAFVEWTKAQPCACCGEAPRQWWQRDAWGNDCAHVRSRGAGGDHTHVIAACPACHDANRPTGQYAMAREHQRRWTAYQEGAA